MLTRTLTGRALTGLGALVFLTGALGGPAVSTARAAGMADDKPAPKQDKRGKKELDDVYKRWLKEDVVYIISPEEKEAFLKLQTDEEREQFVEQFWLRRDPDPDTPENQTREEHYRRIAYANEHFTSGKAGWRTDRGRMYVAWGKPDEIESYPTGQQYNRQMWEGGGNTTTYPYEVWWYRHLDGVGDDIEIEFVDPSGSGEYRIARTPWEKDALLYVGNAGATEWEQLGLSNRAERPAYGGAQIQSGRYYNPPSNKTQFAILEKLAALERGPGAYTQYDTISAADPKLETNALPFAVRADFYRVSSNNVATALTVQLDHKDLAFENKGGIYSANVNISARLTQLSGKGAGTFEDIVSTPRYGEDNIAVGQQQKSVYQKNVLLPPGRYKVTVISRDTTSGKTGLITQSFVVPKYEEAKFSTSSVVLAQRIEQTTNRVASPQFIIGKFKVIPNVSNVYKVGQQLDVFMQIYDAEMDQSSLRPTVDVEYVILKDGKEIKRVKNDASNKLYDLSGSQIAVGQLIPTDGLDAATYTLQVRVTDRVAQKTLTPETEFTIVP
jgi:GWxTD domain-containing protein